MNDAASIDYSHVTPGRKLLVLFQPQQWIHDDAIDSGPPVSVDVTSAYLALTPEKRAALRDNKDESDNLVHASGKVWAEHGGPGYVRIEEFLTAFHDPNDSPDPSFACGANCGATFASTDERDHHETSSACPKWGMDHPTYHTDEVYRQRAKDRLRAANIEMFEDGEPPAVAVMVNEESNEGFLGAWVTVDLWIAA